MNEEEKKEPKQEEPQEIDYIEEIKKLKAESVSKEEYKKLQAENKQLFEALVEGGQVESSKEETEKIDVDKIRERIESRDPRITSMEGFEMALKLRQADLEAGKVDPFISVNNKNPTQEDYDRAENRAKIYQECLDYADGDASLFSQELQRRMIDSVGLKK